MPQTSHRNRAKALRSAMALRLGPLLQLCKMATARLSVQLDKSRGQRHHLCWLRRHAPSTRFTVTGQMAWTNRNCSLDGEPEVTAPRPPTWRVFLNGLIDTKDYTANGIKLRVEQIGFETSQLDEEMDESWWEMHYDRISGPSAKAYRLLERIDLGPDLTVGTAR
jgi:hypothetical protein